METRHTDRGFESQLRELRRQVLLMAGLVEAMIARSLEALTTRSVALAKETIVSDGRVNATELEVDELCRIILARRQPMGSDLRFITLTLKMVTDLERVGDLAVNICERAIDLEALPPVAIHDGIVEMAEKVQASVHDAIDAFVEQDAAKAREVIARDDAVDALYGTVFNDLLGVMRRDPAMLERGIHIQSVAKWLERMADHSTNIAEQVIFMVEGEDVRHAGKLRR